MLRKIFSLMIGIGVVGFSALSCPAAGSASAAGGSDFLSDEFYQEEGDITVNDPLESMNRVVFNFNDKVYIWVMDPVARAYSHVLPGDVRGCINNFFWNLAEPVRFLHTLLQGRFADAGDVLARFTINSTLGVYGLGDPAAREFKLSQVEATLGGTLAKWGVGDGFYLVVPLYGPSTLRDFTGTVVDGLGMTPYYTWADTIYEVGGVYLGKETNMLSLHLGEYENLKKVLFDPYLSFRNGYLQHRRESREFQILAPRQ